MAATGTWLDAARMKLVKARLALMPISACDETESREAIVGNAIALAGGRYDRIIVFGDGTWDLRTARNLGLPFIGIGDVQRLLAAGAPVAFPDYRDSSSILELLG